MLINKMEKITKLNKNKELGVVDGITYYIDDYGTFFTDKLNQADMLGGTDEDDRNIRANHIRLERIKFFNTDNKMLDFGCGNGLFVDYLKSQGVDADGYDPYSEKFNQLPNKQYDIITMIEVVEHLTSPYDEFDAVFSLLKQNGIVYIETSFSDFVVIGDYYLTPGIGHSTIWSHTGLTAMMESRGFIEGQHFNRNTRIYFKK